MPRQILAMVRKDLQLFFSDRRAVIMSFLVPIAIASFSVDLRPEPQHRGREDSDHRHDQTA
jgi:hypothetical protein